MNKLVQLKNGYLYNGFFLENQQRSLSIDNMLSEISIPDWLISSVEETESAYPCPYNDAKDFLSGSCHLFAVVLHKIYSYDVYEIRYKKALHWFCIKDYQSSKAYIDVRGVTTDKKLFLSPFVPKQHDHYEIKKIEETDMVFQEDWIETGTLFAYYIIANSNGLYDI